ncbi:MAG TPA: hypothetical protein VM093_05930 [Aeromicrobium sp.]|nr:hypothetical protein [Aeromicrobium sp.]
MAPSTPASRSEVRAVYGGFGMAGGRLLSALIEPRTLFAWPGLFLLVELAGGALLVLPR